MHAGKYIRFVHQIKGPPRSHRLDYNNLVDSVGAAEFVRSLEGLYTDLNSQAKMSQIISEQSPMTFLSHCKSGARGTK